MHKGLAEHARQIGIFAANRAQNINMLLDTRELNAFEPVGNPNRHAQGGVHHRRHLGKKGIAAGAQYRGVEGTVGGEGIAAVCGRPPHLFNGLFNFADIGPDRRGHLSRRRLDCKAHAQKVLDQGYRHRSSQQPRQHIGVEQIPVAFLSHYGAAPRPGLNQALCGQHFQGFAGDRATYPVFFREFGFGGQTVADGEVTAHDGAADIFNQRSRHITGHYTRDHHQHPFVRFAALGNTPATERSSAR